MATGILPKDIAIFAVPVVTLMLGLLIGYLAQRSGYCSIGGFRDYFLFRHTRLLSGYLTLVIASFAGYLFFWFVTQAAMDRFFWAFTTGLFTPIPGAPAGLNPAAYFLFAIIPGFFIGLICVFLGGCPIRQTVMASEGNYKAAWFFVGMCVGSIIFAAWISGAVVIMMKTLGFGI
jgi:uncharacterized protein